VTAARAGESTLIVPSLFGNRGFIGGILTTIACFLALDGFWLVFTLHVQFGLGYSALRTGVAGIAFSIATAVAAGVGASKLAPRIGRPVITVGGVIMVLGTIAFYETARIVGGDLTPWNLLPAMAITGFGFGAVIAPLFDFALAEVPTDDAGAGSGVLGAVQQMGGAIGVAVIGVVFFNALAPAGAAAAHDEAQSLRASVPPVVVSAFLRCSDAVSRSKDPSVTPAECRTPPGIDPANPVLVRVRDAGRRVQQEAFSTAFQHAMIADTIAVAIALGTTLLLPRRKGDGPAVAL
jgi:MFS family permease